MVLEKLDCHLENQSFIISHILPQDELHIVIPHILSQELQKYQIRNVKNGSMLTSYNEKD